MNFTTSIKTCFSKYATFSGRASRSEFWFFALFNWIVVFIIQMIAIFIGISVAAGGSAESAAGSIAGIYVIYSLYALAVFLPNISVLVRRLHDIGKSGWNYWWCLVPLVGCIYLLILLIRESDKEENEYGMLEENV